MSNDPGGVRPASRVALPLLRTLARMDLALERHVSRGRRVLEGLLPSVLTDDELARLCATLYDQRGEPTRDGPMEWESEWLHTIFPKSPARVLVGGAGYGRECRFLLERGDIVSAYEPGPRAAGACRAIAPCEVASHEDLVRAISGAPSPLHALAKQRYDAVLLGWASLTHVLDPDRRIATIVACSKLTDGPILASVRTTEDAVPPPDRWSRTGHKIGQILGGRTPHPGLHYQPQHGFAATLRTDELDAMADAIDREVIADVWPGITALAFLPR